MRWILSSFIVATFVSRVFAEDAAAFLDRWSAAEASAASMKVAFTQEVKNPALRDPVKSAGRMWRFSDGAFRWELGQPPQTALLKKGESLQLWEAQSGKWTTLDAKDRRFRMWVPFLTGKGVSAAAVAKEFTASLIEGVSPISVMLELVPKSSMARKYIKSIRLTVHTDTLRLTRLVVTQADGGGTAMMFGNPSALAESERKNVLGE